MPGVETGRRRFDLEPGLQAHCEIASKLAARACADSIASNGKRGIYRSIPLRLNRGYGCLPAPCSERTSLEDVRVFTLPPCSYLPVHTCCFTLKNLESLRLCSSLGPAETPNLLVAFPSRVTTLTAICVIFTVRAHFLVSWNVAGKYKYLAGTVISCSSPLSESHHYPRKPHIYPIDHQTQAAMTASTRQLVPGIMPPFVTFFRENEDIDHPAVAKHVVRLANAGCTALVALGSNGELFHLVAQERKDVISTTRKALDDAGFTRLPIIAGCSAMSVREAISNTKDAHSAGADYGLILPPSFYKPLLSSQDLIKFYQDIADESPIPIIIYNYPLAVAGIDLGSPEIEKLAQHKNIIGVKLTCGNVGKAARLALPGVGGGPSAAQKTKPFHVLAGTADFLFQALTIGAGGCVPGAANVFPRLCVETMKAFEAGDMKKARELQALLSRGDLAAQAQNLVGTKEALQHWWGYGGGYVRRPLKKWEGTLDIWEEAVEAEKKLEKEAGVKEGAKDIGPAGGRKAVNSRPQK